MQTTILAILLATSTATHAFAPYSHAKALSRAESMARFSGGQLAERTGTAGVYDSAVALGASKAATPNKKLLPLAFLSGAHIALGGLLAVSIGGSVPMIKASNPGIQRALLGCFGLPMGLLMVLGGGGELVTGNMAICTAAVAACVESHHWFGGIQRILQTSLPPSNRTRFPRFLDRSSSPPEFSTTEGRPLKFVPEHSS